MHVSVARAIRDGLLVAVHRKVEGVDDVDCFVLAASKNWLLLKEADALRPDGFWVFRMDKVISLQRSRFHEFKQRMMKLSGLLKGLRAGAGIDLTDIHTILRWFVKRKRLCILFTENKKEWWRLHCAIAGATQKELKLVPFDGAGRWEKVKSSGRWIPKAITAIRFDSHYLRLYEEHAEIGRGS